MLDHSIPPSSKPGIGSYAAPSLGYALFATRWLQAPLYFGLVAAQGVYVYKFFHELWHLIAHILTGHANETHVMLAVLKLVDVVMIANLLIMVIVGGYETFVSRIGLQGHRDQPEWLSHVNSNVLKVKLATAIVGISSVHLLQMFVDVDHTSQHSLLWGTVIHMAFILSAAILAYMSGPMEWRSRNHRHSRPSGSGPGLDHDHSHDGGPHPPRPPRPSSPTQLIISERALPEGITSSVALRDLLPAQATGERRTPADGVVIQGSREPAPAGRPARIPVPAQAGAAETAGRTEPGRPRPYTTTAAEARTGGVETRIRAAGFPARKSLEEYDASGQTHADWDAITRLGKLDFLAARGNAVLIGPPGTGKTHLAIALGTRACQSGHEVRFATAAEWVARLTTAYADGRLTEELAALDRYALLIVDEIGYLPFDTEATSLLFRLVSHRYERGSVVVTGDRPIGRWADVFGDSPVTRAMVDRVAHHAEIVTLQGDSYRLRTTTPERALPAVPDVY
ncbi:IS21-like element helper ATPase IstB [Streptomyces sp. NPDC000594]|uniref:IS21-like element helper ATPase IstB n=1 Tax=Streptomyces sp. NPDC000594 TaxID=3154261 RepID=UPI00331D2ED3